MCLKIGNMVLGLRGDAKAFKILFSRESGPLFESCKLLFHLQNEDFISL